MKINDELDFRVLCVEELHEFSNARPGSNLDRVMKQNVQLASMLGELCQRLRKVELMLEGKDK